MTQRDEFTENVRRIIAQRAAYRCSNPICRALTVRPHSDENKAVITGVAAHICAAATGGPRYNPHQNTDERKSVTNAIWVCHSCSDLIDKDDKKFPASLLHAWKTDHEAWVLGENFIPAYPSLTIETMSGLMTPQSGAFNFDSQTASTYRDHLLQIRTGSRHEIYQLKIRVQFPESAISYTPLEKPAGVRFQVMPERPQMTAHVSGGGKLSGVMGRKPTNVLIITVERLIPGRLISFMLRTIQGAADKEPIEFKDIPGYDKMLFNWALGTFLYKEREFFFERRFIIPIHKVGERRYTAEPAEDDDGQRTLMQLTFIG